MTDNLLKLVHEMSRKLPKVSMEKLAHKQKVNELPRRPC